VTDAPGRPMRTVLQADGRRKAYRPLPKAARARSVAAGVAHYERGEAFEAHEAWEPAWMGTADVAERALLQGLIKLAAADVHAARGNPCGVATNLRGALERLRVASDRAPGIVVDLPTLIATCAGRLERAARGEPTTSIPIPWRSA
jgi:predicted metal-dependent hydrolase